MPIERGKTIDIKALSVSEGMSAKGEREVFFEINGQLRSVMIRDEAASKVSSRLLPLLCRVGTYLGALF